MKKIRLKLWGVRGSCPVSGKEFAKYGGETSCYEIETSQARLIIDAGTGIRALGLKLAAEKKRKPLHIFLTHYHLDHICGLPHFKPLFLKNYPITFYLPKFSAKNPQKILENFISAPYFPKELTKSPANIRFHALPAKLHVFHLNDITVSSMLMNHPNASLGYRFDFSSKKSITIVSDNEITAENITVLTRFSEKSDILLHDAQYTEKEYLTRVGWGHSSQMRVLKMSKNAAVKKTLLIHHDPLKNDLEIDILKRKLFNPQDINRQKTGCQFSVQFDEFLL